MCPSHVVFWKAFPSIAQERKDLSSYRHLCCYFGCWYRPHKARAAIGHSGHNAQSHSAFGQDPTKTTGRVYDQGPAVFKPGPVLPFVDFHDSAYPSLPGGNPTTFTMCLNTLYFCGLCKAAVGCYTQPCPPQFHKAPNHTQRYCQPYTIHPPTAYSCPNANCIASTQLHWALREQQETAMRQGEANLNFVPPPEPKAVGSDDDELCDPTLTKSYPPPRIAKATLGPEWLSRSEWHKALELDARGKNVLEIAYALDKNASKMRTYMDLYLKNANANVHNEAPLPSANPTKSSTDSRSASTVSSDEGLFPFGHEVMLPQEGMPDPSFSFLNEQEREIVFRMFQRNESVRSMAERVRKHRHKVSQYINAYMRPKLLKLQAEERQAEDAATLTPITPLSGGILQFALSKPIVPIPVAPRTAPLTTAFPASQTVDPIAASPGPTSLPEPSQQSPNDSAEWDALLALVNSLPLNPQPPDQAPVIGEEPMPSGETDLVESSKSFDSGEDSLFGDDSPVDKNHKAPAHLVSTQEEVAEPTSKKRKFEENSGEVPRRASKRLRHRSLP